MKTRENVDYTNRDYEGFRQDMITRLQQLIPEYTDTSDSDAGIVLIDLLAHGLDVLSYYNDKVANEVFLPTARERNSVSMIAENILGYEIRENTPSKVYQVFEIVESETSTIIPKGTLLRTQATYGEDSLYFETDEDLRIPAGCTGLEQDEQGEYLYKVSCTQGYTVYNDILGTSDGSSSQKFTVPRAGAIRNSVKVFVIGENGVNEEWNMVSNFIQSDPSSKDYVVTIDGNNVATVTFGNGKSGKIPFTRDKGITATYRIGGGSVGNVSPKAICKTDDNLAGILKTFNPAEPYVLGVDKETLDEIKNNAPAHLKTQWGCITLEDYADIIRSEDYVLDAKSVNSESRPLDIIIYVLPKNYLDMSEETLIQLRRKLQEIYISKKALGVTVTIAWAKIKEISVTLEVQIDELGSRDEVQDIINKMLLDSYHVRNRHIGEPIYISRIMASVLSLDNVIDVKGYLDDNKTTIQGDNEVVTLTKVNLVVTGGVA